MSVIDFFVNSFEDFFFFKFLKCVLKAEGEEGIRGRDGWMVSLMQWT